MRSPSSFLLVLVSALVAGACSMPPAAAPEPSMTIAYLEVVTPEVEPTCQALAAMHGVTFGPADPALGGARTAAMPDGGLLGVRAPMHAQESAVTRSYVLVPDIAAAVAKAEAAGATIAVPAMPLPGHGTCAIYVLGGIEHGLWQR